jgi:phosphoglycolate phosphatase
MPEVNDGGFAPVPRVESPIAAFWGFSEHARMTNNRAIFFDIDGVLVDSLEPHLQICRDKSREFGLHLDIPNAHALRKMVMNGVVISPMKQLFLAVGFPEPFADRATRDYEQEFSRRYAPRPFPGVDRALTTLAKSLPGLTLGFVTSNTLSIVHDSLGELAGFFSDDYQFAFDHPAGLNKAQALEIGAKRARLDPQSVLFVGDQPTDRAAAKTAGTQFLGVSFGWGFSGDEPDLQLARSVDDLTSRLLDWSRV